MDHMEDNKLGSDCLLMILSSKTGFKVVGKHSLGSTVFGAYNSKGHRQNFFDASR